MTDFFACRPITLWCCNRCGYVDVVREGADNTCPGCHRATSGRTHRYRPDPIGHRTDRERLSLLPTDQGED